jgi:hypothetical protein
LSVCAIEVVPVESSPFAEAFFAPRPRSEMMRNYRLKLAGIDMMRLWPEALRRYLDRSVAGLMLTLPKRHYGATLY